MSKQDGFFKLIRVVASEMAILWLALHWGNPELFKVWIYETPDPRTGRIFAQDNPEKLPNPKSVASWVATYRGWILLTALLMLLQFVVLNAVVKFWIDSTALVVRLFAVATFLRLFAGMIAAKELGSDLAITAKVIRG